VKYWTTYVRLLISAIIKSLFKWPRKVQRYRILSHTHLGAMLLSLCRPISDGVKILNTGRLKENIRIERMPQYDSINL
jgi:hypothetical protein